MIDGLSESRKDEDRRLMTYQVPNWNVSGTKLPCGKSEGSPHRPYVRDVPNIYGIAFYLF